MDQSQVYQRKHEPDEDGYRTPQRRSRPESGTPTNLEYERNVRHNIRLMHSRGASVRWLADFYNIPATTIYRIVKR